jgi:hypothetical protein
MIGRWLVMSVGFVGLAFLASSVAFGAPPDQRAGIERARAAGIFIDAKAEQLMANAPIGSCFNDPTQPKCPPARAMSGEQGTDRGPDGGVAYAPSGDADATSATTSRRTGATANAAAYTPQCFLYASVPDYFVAAVHGDGTNICTSAVTKHELYVNLDKYYSTKWYQMDIGFNTGGPGTTIKVHAIAVRRAVGPSIIRDE